MRKGEGGHGVPPLLLFIVRGPPRARVDLSVPFPSPFRFVCCGQRDCPGVPTRARGRRDGVRSLLPRQGKRAAFGVSFRVLSSFTVGRGLGVSGLALAAAKLTRARPYLTPCSADGFNINNKFIKGECMERSSSR
jgi:hypothetical protein